MMKAINQAESKNKNARQWPEQPSLFFKFAGSSDQVKLDMKRTSEIVKRNKGTKLETATTEEEKEALWRARKVALWSALELLPGSRAWTTDVCVPMSKFPTLVAETKEDLDRLNVVAPIVGHAGDGVSTPLRPNYFILQRANKRHCVYAYHRTSTAFYSSETQKDSHASKKVFII